MVGERGRQEPSSDSPMYYSAIDKPHATHTHTHTLAADQLVETVLSLLFYRF